MAYKAVLFDMDGTVLDTLDDLSNAVNAALRQFGMPERTREEAAAFLGNGAARLIHLSVPEGCPQDLEEQVLAWYKPWYEDHCRILTRPYPGILPLMEHLRQRGVKLAVISNKPDGPVKELAASFFPGLLDSAVGESETVRRKPDPDSVLAAAAQMGLAPEDCVYVGDTEVDLATARNAGMDVIAVSWGFRSRAQLRAAGAERIAATAEDLERLIADH